MHKIQKSLPISSLIWAALVTAIVLTLAASVEAEEDNATTTVTENQTGGQVRPVPERPQPMPRATSTPPLERVNERPVPFNASGTRPMDRGPIGNASGTRPMNIGNTEGREAAMNLVAERRAAFEARRAALIEDMTARKDAIAEKRAMMASSTLGRRAVLKEEAQTRIVDRSNKLTEVVRSAITRLEDMSNRLRAHATKLSTESNNVSAVIPLLDEIDRLLVSAEEVLEGIDTNVTYATTSDKPTEDWSDAKEQFMEVRTILMEVRELLREALLSLKAISPTKPADVMPTNQ